MNSREIPDCRTTQINAQTDAVAIDDRPVYLGTMQDDIDAAASVARFVLL
jgi:hypothetical protein